VGKSFIRRSGLCSSLRLRGGIEADKRTALLIKQKSNENAENIQGYSQTILLLE
jgi:hypothetical protein